MENNAEARIGHLIKDMQDGLMPEALAEWYTVVRDRARALCPHLKSKISVEQDPILPMKFNLKVSKRTVPYVLAALEQTLPEMPYSTRLYFERVHAIILDEFEVTGTAQ